MKSTLPQQQQLETNISKANSAWTEEDVKASADGLERRHCNNSNSEDNIATPDVVMNPNEQLAAVELDKGIRKFWKRHGNRFRTVWKGMTVEARKRLLLTASPAMAKTSADPHSHGQLLLIPEFVVSDLSNDHTKLISVVQEAVVKEDLGYMYFLDSLQIRNLVYQNKLSPDCTKQDSIAFLQLQKYPGELMHINMNKIDPKARESLTNMIKQNIAIEGPIFSHVFQRRHSLLSTIALILDEMRNCVFDMDTPVNYKPRILKRALQCCAEGCENIKSRHPDTGKERPLLLCSICHLSAYCSRECQKADWPTHKKTCTPGSKSNKAENTTGGAKK